MNHRKALALVLNVLAIAIIACRTGSSRKLVLYPSPTFDATQTPVIQTVVSTKVVQITSTPIPTVPTFTRTPVLKLCVSATEAVYLRPSPSTNNYPIVHVENGKQVDDLGGRSHGFWFVQYQDKQGWINGKYLKNCN